MSANASCPFCELPAQRIVLRNALAIALRDGYPIAAGHTLVTPIRHVASFFDLTSKDRDAMLSLLVEVRAVLQAEFSSAAFNVGINDGTAAGQTIFHSHIHLIPRYTGDTADPRGGVRWIFPERATYSL